MKEPQLKQRISSQSTDNLFNEYDNEDLFCDENENLATSSEQYDKMIYDDEEFEEKGI